jgi:hypothetical protein
MELASRILSRGTSIALCTFRHLGSNEREVSMKNYLVLLALLAMTQSSCAFIGGAATGAVAAGAGYEIQAKRQMDRLEEDFKKRRISREEYEDRKAQIEKGSIIY